MATGLWVCLIAPVTFFVSWALYAKTVVGNWVDLIFAGPPAEPALVYEMIGLYDLCVWDSYPGGDV